MSRKAKRKLGVCICVAAGLIVSGVLLIHIFFGPQENIFFLEYENEYEKEDTIIYQYNSKSKTVVEIGRVQGQLQDCVINSDETYITGVIYDGDFEIVRYDLATGTVEMLDAARKIDILTDNRWYNTWIYNEGNKIFVNYKDGNDRTKWLLYDLAADQYDIMDGEGAAIDYLTIYNDRLWYIADNGALYQYDLERKEKTQMMESVHYGAAVMPETGLVAYTKKCQKEICLYNILTKERSYISGGGWNIYYGDLEWTNSRWSDNGREFFYIEYFPGFFNAATTKLMVYDVIMHRSRCIYKVRMTGHEFRYVMKI